MKSISQSFEAVCDSIGRAIQADENLGRSMAAVGATIIEELEKQALAAIIRNAAISEKNPIAAIVAATVGFSIIKGLFAKISKTNDGRSTANVSNGYTNTRSSGYESGNTVVVRGQDLYLVMNNYSKSKGFTTGG
jgi:hypothetical protein